MIARTTAEPGRRRSDPSAQSRKKPHTFSMCVEAQMCGSVRFRRGDNRKADGAVATYRIDVIKGHMCKVGTSVAFIERLYCV